MDAAGERVGTWTVAVEPASGARIASLKGPSGREWLWRRPEAAADRAAVRAGDPFVDAGGWEECFPTIAGASDHGEVWDRPWSPQPSGGVLAVSGSDFRLARALHAEGATLVARYRLEAEPGFRFVWAAHMLLEVSEAGRLEAEPGTICRLWPDHWRSTGAVPAVEGPWPAPLGASLDRLASDGSALFFMLLGPGPLMVADGARLTLRLRAAGQPTAIAVWRNLGGWPEGAPYRSVGVEPAIGRHYDRDLAAPGDVGIVPASGIAEWDLEISEG